MSLGVWKCRVSLATLSDPVPHHDASVRATAPHHPLPGRKGLAGGVQQPQDRLRQVKLNNQPPTSSVHAITGNKGLQG